MVLILLDKFPDPGHDTTTREIDVAGTSVESGCSFCDGQFFDTGQPKCLPGVLSDQLAHSLRSPLKDLSLIFKIESTGKFRRCWLIRQAGVGFQIVTSQWSISFLPDHVDCGISSDRQKPGSETAAIIPLQPAESEWATAIKNLLNQFSASAA